MVGHLANLQYKIQFYKLLPTDAYLIFIFLINQRKISKQTKILIKGSHNGGYLSSSKRSAITLSLGSIALANIADNPTGTSHTTKAIKSCIFLAFFVIDLSI